MKITKVETIVLKREVKNPLGGSQYTYDVGGHLLTRIYTDEGLVGNATTYFGLIASGMETVKLIIDRELTPVLLGQDPHMVRMLRRQMRVVTEYYGTVGVACLGISAVDIALWDIIGKAAGLPTAKVLGACRESIPRLRHGGMVCGRRDVRLCQAMYRCRPGRIPGGKIKDWQRPAF